MKNLAKELDSWRVIASPDHYCHYMLDLAIKIPKNSFRADYWRKINFEMREMGHSKRMIKRFIRLVSKRIDEFNSL